MPDAPIPAGSLNEAPAHLNFPAAATIRVQLADMLSREELGQLLALGESKGQTPDQTILDAVRSYLRAA